MSAPAPPPSGPTPAPAGAADEGTTGLVHVELRAFPCLLRAEFVKNFEAGHGEYLPCTVFGVSSYVGHTPTFEVLVEDRFLFSYIPVQALAARPCEPLALEDAAFFNCPDDTVTAVYHRHLLEIGGCTVYGRDGAPRAAGTYLCTFDWYRADHSLHLVLLQTGQYVLWPNHRLAFTDARPPLPPFRRSSREWRV